MPTSAPIYMRRREVWARLEEVGIAPSQLEKLVEAGAVKRIKLTPNGRGYYLREEIERQIVEPQRQAQAVGK